MGFLGKSYLIGNAAGRKIFEKIAGLPIVDLHNHANVAEIAGDLPYADMWQLFAATDHYVWEVMRKAGVEEHLITGEASNREKFLALAEVFPQIAGNPVYEWIHLDLKRYLKIDDNLSGETGEKIWSEGNKKLKTAAFRPQHLLQKQLNVELICSTDDPLDTLEHHDKINKEAGRTMVRPTWRPDKAMKIAAPGWNAYIDRLAKRSGMEVKSAKDLMKALKLTHDFFHAKGCVASDHGLELPLGHEVDYDRANSIFKRARHGRELATEQVNDFMSYFLTRVAEFNTTKNWVTQLHLGAVRDVRTSLYESLGPDSGGDVSNHYQDYCRELAAFLNRFDGKLKVVLYCLDPGHQPTLATLARAFGANVRLGSAWWLCDTPVGMKRQLEYIGSVDLLSAFAGMVSDSRKLLSYGSRFEMFRRVLSHVIGEMVEAGQMPLEVAESLAAAICYENPKKFFGV